MIKDDPAGGLGKAINGGFANDPKNLSKMNFFALNSTEREKRLKDYKKVIVVREPLSRLLSAYRNKLEPTDRNDWFQKTSQTVHRGSLSRRNETSGSPVATYQEFLGRVFEVRSVKF